MGVLAVPISRATATSLPTLFQAIACVPVRHGHHKPRYRQPQPELAGHAPGHGEKIWIFHNVLNREVVYSHTGILNPHKALKQIPFSGKGSKPAKIRKDFWRHLALVQFPQGQGIVGQSVFQRLREFRARHFTEWDDSMLFREEKPYPSLEVRDEEETTKVRTRKERGKALHNQKANAIADLAAVLSGVGAGSRVPLKDGSLCPVEVSWADINDHKYAESWTANVTHSLLQAPKHRVDTAPVTETVSSSSLPPPQQEKPKVEETPESKKSLWPWRR